MNRLERLVKCLVFLIFLLAATAAAQDAAAFKDLRQHTADGKKIDAAATVTRESVTIERKKQAPLVLPWTSVTGITYDRRTKMRKMAPQYGKAIDHFFIIRYTLPSGGDFIELEAEKDDASRLLNTLETRSGKTIEKIGG